MKGSEAKSLIPELRAVVGIINAIRDFLASTDRFPRKRVQVFLWAVAQAADPATQVFSVRIPAR